MRRPVPQALRRPGLPLTAVAGLVLAVASAASAPSAFARTAADPAPTAAPAACAAPAPAGHAACGALKVTGVSPAATHPLATPSGLGPGDLRSAYGLPANGGSGVTVAIIDAYDDPNAAADMAAYRSEFGLTPCTVVSGCFTKVGQTGSTTSLPPADAGWAEEESADLDMVSATAPAAHILLVEANSASEANLGTAVNEAVALGARSVDLPFGASESSSDTSYDSSYYNHPGVVESAPAGDSGFGLEYPGASRYVTSVGGTLLTKSSTAKRGWTESADQGGGCSMYESKPSWQNDTFCGAKRTAVDVAAVGDANDGLAVYDTYGGDTGWEVFAGTSLTAGIITGVYADAGVPSAGSSPASFPYAHPTAMYDITTGPGAGTGYDEPTGVGTPNGVTAFKG